MSDSVQTPEPILINEKVVSKEELEAQQKRKDIRLVKESPNKYRELKRLQE